MKTFWIVTIVVIVALAAILIFKPWGCFNPTVPAKSSINADSLALAQQQKEIIEKQAAETINSQAGTIDSLVKSNLVLATSLNDCQGKKISRRLTYVRPSLTKANPAPTPSTITYIPPALAATPSSVSSSAVTNLCGSNNYTEFAVQLNDNSGNWWPQIALDRDQKQYSYAVPNTTRDGINFRIAISQFVDYLAGDVCVTTSGKICIRAGALNNYLGPEKIVKILLLTTGATQWRLVPMSLEGDYYVWQK